MLEPPEELEPPDSDNKELEGHTLVTSPSCIPHCLSLLGLLNRQKNQGTEVEQERVRGEPSDVRVPGSGSVDTMDIQYIGIEVM